MAPTEILARQHFNLAKKIFPKNLNIRLISGKSNYKEKKDILNNYLIKKLILFLVHMQFFKKKYFLKNLD